MRAHIGNFRTYVCLDVLRRTLKYVSGYEVREAINYTDVDDKTIAGANEAGVPLREYTEQWIEAFRDDALRLGIEEPEERPRATDEQNLRAMGDMILALERNGHTYRRDGSIYFRIASFPQDGRLARLDREGMQDGASVDVDEHLQRQSARLRAVERGASRRAVVGLRDRPRSPRLAYRVLRNGAPAAWRAADRSPCGWHRPRLSASRE